MKYAIARLDFDEGLSFHGAFGTKGEAHEYLDRTGMHAEVHCEVVEVRDCHVFAARRAEDPAGDPHVVVTGTLAGGYKLYGPLPGLDAAMEAAAGAPEYAYLMPLIKPE